MKQSILNEVINELYSKFEVIQSDDGEQVVRKVDISDHSIDELIISAHTLSQDDKPIWPSNYVYRSLYAIISTLKYSPDGFHSEEPLVEPNDRYFDLLKWLSGNLVHLAHFDMVLEEFSNTEITATFANVAMEAQRRELSQIEANTRQYIVSLVDERLTEFC